MDWSPYRMPIWIVTVSVIMFIAVTTGWSILYEVPRWGITLLILVFIVAGIYEIFLSIKEKRCWWQKK
jgi:hypothetical protein